MSSERSSASGSTGVSPGPFAPLFWSSAGTPNVKRLMFATRMAGSSFTAESVFAMTAVFGAIILAVPVVPAITTRLGFAIVIGCADDAVAGGRVAVAGGWIETARVVSGSAL